MPPILFLPHRLFRQSPTTVVSDPRQVMCTRSGCNRLPIESPDWDNEYCSSQCVVDHCRYIDKFLPLSLSLFVILESNKLELNSKLTHHNHSLGICSTLTALIRLLLWIISKCRLKICTFRIKTFLFGTLYWWDFFSIALFISKQTNNNKNRLKSIENWCCMGGFEYIFVQISDYS